MTDNELSNLFFFFYVYIIIFESAVSKISTVKYALYLS